MSFVERPHSGVPALCVKAGNHRRNRSNNVPSRSNGCEDSGLANQYIWLTVKEAGKLLGITDRAVKKNCKNKKYVTEMVHGNGGKQYRILLSSLPKKGQMNWRKEQLSVFDKEVLGVSSSSIDLTKLPELYLQAPDYNRRKYDKYYPFFQSVGFFEDLKLPRLNELKELIIHWNKEHAVYPVGLKSVYKLAKELKEKGVDAFFGGYGQNRGKHWSFADLKKQGLDRVVFGTFRKTFLQPSAPSIRECRGLAAEVALRVGFPPSDKLPSASAFLRRLYSDLEQEYGVSGTAAAYRARYGLAAFERKYGHYLDRDDSDCPAGYAWVFDHAQLDIMVKSPESERLVRFWISAVLDMRSWKLLYYVLKTSTPNAQDVIDVYLGAVARYGVPNTVYLDNGKDYRSKDFSGRTRKVRIEHDETWMRSVLGQTGVARVIFAIPFNARAKRIERWFLKLHEGFERILCKGYTGANTYARTDELKRIIKRGDVLDYGDFIMMLDLFIDDLNNRKTDKQSKLHGLTPDEAFSKFLEERPMLDGEVLVSLMGCTGNSRKIGRNGYEDVEVSKRIGYKALYWGPWMSVWKGKKETVYPRRDLIQPEKAYFFSGDTHEFLGIGYLDFFRVRSLAETAEEQRALSEAWASVNGERKLVKHAIEAPSSGLNGLDVFRMRLSDQKRLRIFRNGSAKEAKPLESRKTGTEGGWSSIEELDELNEKMIRSEAQRIPESDEWDD